MNLQELYALFAGSGQVTTDSRQISEGSLFFALKGEKFDGNAYAADALAKGAVGVVVDDPKIVRDHRYILVPDVLKSLQALARHHRDQLSIPVIGLTGSNGKTTSKELVREALSAGYNVYATAGNLNNHIGVPLSVLSINHSHQIAVIEMGANHVGEIASLCRIANPTHGFITNISKAHVGMFGGIENIIRAKSELYQHLIEQQGVVWINSADPTLKAMAHRFPQPLFYPAKGDFYHCTFVEADPYLKVRAEDGEEIETHLTGRYNFDNVAVALCVAKYFHVNAKEAHAAIRAYAPKNMRSQIVERGTNRIILDAYNANPASMKAAIENLAHMTGNTKVAILGDMLELGEESPTEHRLLGRYLKENRIEKAYLCGPEMKEAVEEFPSAHYFSNASLLMEALKKQPIKHATILVKASRGMALEKVLEYL